MPGPNDPKTKACELCCKRPGENQECLSSFGWNVKPYDIPDLYAKPGSPCNDYNGYCDVFQNCREVDPSGPLATLRKLLLSDEGIESFKKWVVSNWYAVSLIIVGVFALLVSFINLNNDISLLVDERTFLQQCMYVRAILIARNLYYISHMY